MQIAKAIWRLWGCALIGLSLGACAGDFDKQPGLTPIQEQYAAAKHKNNGNAVAELGAGLPGMIWVAEDITVGSCQDSTVVIRFVRFFDQIEGITAEASAPECELIATRYRGKIHSDGLVAITSSFPPSGADENWHPETDERFYMYFNLDENYGVGHIELVNSALAEKGRPLASEKFTLRPFDPEKNRNAPTS
jgi:hypothetical protein